MAKQNRRTLLKTVGGIATVGFLAGCAEEEEEPAPEEEEEEPAPDEEEEEPAPDEEEEEPAPDEEEEEEDGL